MSDDPTDAELLAFARVLIGDKTPYLDPQGLEEAIGRHRDLWSKLYRVNAGLEDTEALRPVD